MTETDHFRALERMYQAGPINQLYDTKLRVSRGEAVVETAVDARYHHSAGAVHGSVYFKVLDDAAFFAANSLEQERFVLTRRFTTELTRPVMGGCLKAVARVTEARRGRFRVEAVVYDGEGQEVGRGAGDFMRGRLPLTGAKGYAAPA